MYVMIDVGSTNTRIAGSQGDGITTPIIVRTPADYTEGLSFICDTARNIAGKKHIDAMAIGLPARLTLDRRGIFKVRYLPDWNGRPIADDVERQLGTHVTLENDTMQVGLGEAAYGAGIGARICVYMTVSTGINAVRVVDGRIEPSVYGYETGYQYLSMDPMRDAMDIFSGTAIAERFGVKSPKELGKDHPVWEELARACAFALYNTLLHWSPDRVVLGGSMFNDIGISIERVSAHLRDINRAFPNMPDIAHSSLGSVGGLWGGLAALQNLHQESVRV